MNAKGFKHKKLILIILDGVGLSKEKQHNAFFLAKTPHLDRFLNECPHSKLDASGEAVGLPDGVMGNSEVGHLTIGSGRILLQDLPRISQFTQEHSFSELPDIQRIGRLDGCIHLLGLVSDGCVHSSFEHLTSLIYDLNRDFPQKKISIHIITDGRDTAIHSGKNYALELENIITSIDHVVISSVMGRFYAMDRDKRWERTKIAYQNLTTTEKFKTFSLASEGIQASYDNKVDDEFIFPFRVQGGLDIKLEDQCIVFNFRADRVRQITEALAVSDFDAFKAPVQISSQNLLTFTEYKQDFHFPILFLKEIPSDGLGEVFSKNKLKQLRIAETEKYAHVTYFFNGGQEKPFRGEDRILVPSARDISTYDKKPEMSAYEVTDQIISNMQKYSVIIANFANGDMVGHTGNEKAAIKAMEVIDKCLGHIALQAAKSNYEILITSDHGNCEQMVCSKTSQPFTQHTANPVPLIWISQTSQASYTLLDGRLSDIAPTLLNILGYKTPKNMTGRNLIIFPTT